MEKTNPLLDHHQRAEYCRTRPDYRKGNKLTAVKAYSVVNESRHLLVFGVPKINLKVEIKKLFSRIGPLDLVSIVTQEMIDADVQVEQFTDCYHIVYKKDFQARKAKKYLDASQFYGGILHISYAPERESIDDTRKKLQMRQNDTSYRLKRNISAEATVFSRKK